MKNVKKIIGILLVVAMLVGTMSIVASAAVPDGKSLRYVVKSDKAAYAENEIATFTVYAEFASATEVECYGEWWFGYNTAQFGPIAEYDPGSTALSTFGVDVSGSAMASGIATTESYVIDGIDEASGYFGDSPYDDMDGAMHVALISGNMDSTTAYGEGLAEVFKFQLKAQADLAAGSFKVLTVVGDGYFAIIDGEDNQYDLDAVSTEFEAAAAPAVVFHEKVQVQWNNKDENTINLGFKGKFNKSDIDIAFADTGKSTNIVEVGAEVTGNKTTKAGTKFVYTPDNETFYFRGVIEGLDLDVAEEANTAITVRYYVIDVDGNEYWSDPVTLKTAAEYAEVLKK